MSEKDGPDMERIVSHIRSIKRHVPPECASDWKMLDEAANLLSVLRYPFRASGDELEFYCLAIERWRALPYDTVLTEAARLFHFAVAIADAKKDA